MTAALQRRYARGEPGAVRIKRVRPSLRRSDAPATGRRARCRCARAGHRDAGGEILIRGKAQATRRRQGQLIEAADDDCRHLRPEAFFHCPQGVGRFRGLDDKELPRIKAERRNAWPVKPAEFQPVPRRHAKQDHTVL